MKAFRHLGLQADVAYRRGTQWKWYSGAREVFEDRSLGVTVVGIVGGPRTEFLAGLGLGYHFKKDAGSCCTEKQGEGHVVAGIRTRLGPRLRLLAGIRGELIPYAVGSEYVDLITKIFVGVHFSP